MIKTVEVLFRVVSIFENGMGFSTDITPLTKWFDTMEEAEEAMENIEEERAESGDVYLDHLEIQKGEVEKNIVIKG